MSATTGIEWTDRVWNPLRGCSRKSQGCKNCYAERVAWRFGSKPGQPYFGLVQMTSQGPRWTGAVRTIPEALCEPLSWKKPVQVFVNSMSDLFHEDVPDAFIDQVFAVMAMCRQHTFQVLTKRAERMMLYLNTPGRADAVARASDRLVDDGLLGIQQHCDRSHYHVDVSERERHWHSVFGRWPLPNVWALVSAEDQQTADERIPFLLKAQAAVRGLSAEPLLGGIWAAKWLAPCCSLHGGPLAADGLCDVCMGRGLWSMPPHQRPSNATLLPALDWVICGGESGPDARPMHPIWPRSLRDQCAEAGVPFFYKQWGEWCTAADLPDQTGDSLYTGDLSHLRVQHLAIDNTGETSAVADTLRGRQVVTLYRVGKPAAGRLLDGRTHDAYPR